MKKKDGRDCSEANVRDLKSNIPYQHFKMKRLILLKEILLQGTKMCKIDLKDA